MSKRTLCVVCVAPGTAKSGPRDGASLSLGLSRGRPARLLVQLKFLQCPCHGSSTTRTCRMNSVSCGPASAICTVCMDGVSRAAENCSSTGWPGRTTKGSTGPRFGRDGPTRSRGGRLSWRGGAVLRVTDAEANVWLPRALRATLGHWGYRPRNPPPPQPPPPHKQRRR